MFHPWHVQLAGAGAAPAAVPFPKAQATIAPQPSVGGQSNHHLGLATAADASRIVDIVASASTRPADAAAIRAGVAALLRQAQAAHAKSAVAHVAAAHNGSDVVSEMRQTTSGAGSHKRGMSYYG